MDDFLLLTTNRYKLRAVIKILHAFFNQLGFVFHPEKTFIGRIEKGFDWLGHQYNHTVYRVKQSNSAPVYT